MKRWILLIGLALLVGQATTSDTVSATSAKVQPLLYRDQLSKGEKKKGFIDVSNPTGQSVTYKTEVKAFRQIDDKGRLQFYDDAQISAGLIPDFQEFTLGPREAMRLYFLVDGTKLPSGDVMAALLVGAGSRSEGSVASAQVGTLFTLVNGTPGPRKAVVEKVNTSFVQFSETIRGSYRIKNPAASAQATGFTPTVLVSISPLTAQKLIESPLVFAGRTREKTFELDSNRFGFYKMTVQYQDSKKSAWVFLVTGIWRWITVAMLVGLLLWVGYRIRSQKQRPNGKLR